MNKRHSQSKQKARAELSARYLAALRRHLDDERADNGDRAQGLGRAVLEAGLAPLDLAIMHEKAVVTLTASRDLTTLRSSWFIRKGFFFTQALIPIEAALRATEATVSQLHHRNETLRLHTAALTRGNLRLQREVLRRQSGETAIMKGQAKYRVLFLESQVMQKKLRQLARQILSAQEEERKKISRELHDEVVQTLVGINVELAALGRGATIGVHTLKSKIAHTQRLVEHSVNSVHRFARELRPAVLDDLGLIPALHAYSKSLAARKKIKIRLTAFSGVEALADAKRTVLFRVAQEALINVVRHAQATEAGVTISKMPGAIRIEISDNGKSFPVRKTLFAKTNKRLGLVGMQERVEMVGGTLTIESAPGQGTTIRAEVPFNPEKTK